MGPPSYMRSVVDPHVVMRRMAVSVLRETACNMATLRYASTRQTLLGAARWRSICPCVWLLLKIVSSTIKHSGCYMQLYHVSIYVFCVIHCTRWCSFRRDTQTTENACLLVTYKYRSMCWPLWLVEVSWNVMSHAQKPDFVFRGKRTSLFKSARWGVSVQSTAGTAEVCASAVVTLDTPCSEVVWRVLATHCIRQFPLQFPLTCVTVWHHISTGLYYKIW